MSRTSRLLTLLASTLIGVDAGAQQYTLVDLGTLGGPTSQGSGINSSGDVVGQSPVAGPVPATQPHAFLYKYSQGKMTDLGTLGGTGAATGTVESAAFGINDADQVTGTAQVTSGGPQYPFLYSNGVMTPVGPDRGTGYAINDSGWVTGQIDCCGGAAYAFLYNGIELQNLGSPVGASSIGLGINGLGEVVGQAGFSTGYQAFAYVSSAGTFQDLGTLGKPYPQPSSTATAINLLGQITGNSVTASNATHAFLYFAGVMLDIGYLPAYESNSYGLAINNAGQVVGSSGVSGSQAAFLYSNGQMLDLNTLLVDNQYQVHLDTATGINDNGWIVANGTAGTFSGDPNGTDGHAFLLVPANPVFAVSVAASTSSPPTTDSNGNYLVTLVVTNTGNATLSTVEVAAASLVVNQGGKAVSTATSLALPVQLYAIAPGASSKVTVSFPSSAGVPGAAAVVRWTLQDSAGNSAGSLRLTLP